MRPISWLHISDIHMRPRDEWPQEVVMRAMCDDIARKRAERTADFILITGDLAFSGKADEYTLLGTLLDEFVAASGVPRERIFCIPGNHDIDRDRQRFCFQGARAALQNQGAADVFLGSPAEEDFVSLLTREANFRSFRNSYFATQQRTATADGLGYVARIVIDGVRLAIIGLDSAWLAQGGIEDHTRLLVGERQVMNALDVAYDGNDPPHVVVAMAHHPLHLLQDFDRRSIQTRIEAKCHFFHCGHLHESEERATGQSAAGCLTLAAGASFESRHSHNTYSSITLDLLRAERIVRTARYNPSGGTFESVAMSTYRIEVLPTATPTVGDLAQALIMHTPTPWPTYLAALLLGKKTEIAVPAGSGHVMASFAVIEAEMATDLRDRTIAFFTFRNVLSVLFGREPLESILSQHGDAVARYNATLLTISERDPGLRGRLDSQEQEARMFATAQVDSTLGYTLALLAELAEASDWHLLREQAVRHMDSGDPSVARHATRMLALALAHSDDPDDRRRAGDLYRALVESEPTEPTDAGNLATLLMDGGRMDEAKIVVLEGIARCHASATDYLGGIGHRIVAATGDRKFREQLSATIAERGRK